MGHAIERTSPKGARFVGRCRKCGATGLAIDAPFDPCPADPVHSDTAALLELMDAAVEAAPEQTELKWIDAGGGNWFARCQFGTYCVNTTFGWARLDPMDPKGMMGDTWEPDRPLQWAEADYQRRRQQAGSKREAD